MNISDGLTIRRALRDDARAIARVHVDSWQTTYRGIVPEDYIATRTYAEREKVWDRVTADPSNHTFLAEAGGRIIGFANGGKNRGDESDYAGELYSIYLLQSHQQQGVGRRLTLTIASELHREGMKSMIVWVLRNNPACEFYRKLGGKPAASKLIVMGTATLEEVAYGWPDIGALARGV